MGSGHACRPDRRGSVASELLVGHRRDPAIEQFEDLLTLARGEEGVEPLAEREGKRHHRRIGRRPALIEHKPTHIRRHGGRAPGGQPTEGMANQIDLGSSLCCGRVDHGGYILELACEVVIGPVTACAPAPPIHCMQHEVRLEVGTHRIPGRVV